jgi:hypothetical protein
MRSIAYRCNRLVNRKTAIVVKMTPYVGISLEREAGESVQYPFLVILLGSVVLRQRVLRYVDRKTIPIFFKLTTCKSLNSLDLTSRALYIIGKFIST